MFKIVRTDTGPTWDIVCECYSFSRAWQIAAILKDSFGDIMILRGDDEQVWNSREGLTNAF